MRLVTLLTLALALPAGVAAATTDPAGVSDRGATPLERASFVALPATYKLNVTIAVRGIRSGRRTTPLNEELSLEGAAFGVASEYLVTARHLIVPSNARLLRELRRSDLDPKTNRVLFDPVREVALWQASTERAAAEEGDEPIRGQVGDATTRRLSDALTDLALIRIDDAAAPTLRLDDGASAGTAVAMPGFGDPGPSRAIPTVRYGSLLGIPPVEGTGARPFVALQLPVSRGDSGAPVIGVTGRVHGVVLRQRSDRDTDPSIPPIMARADAVRALLRDAGARNEESSATMTFRRGMEAFWRRDYATAAEILGEVSSPLAQYQENRAGQLVSAPYALTSTPTRQGVAISLGLAAALLAGILALIRGQMGPGPPGPARRLTRTE
jgi:hypothetical protein